MPTLTHVLLDSFLDVSGVSEGNYDDPRLTNWDAVVQVRVL